MRITDIYPEKDLFLGEYEINYKSQEKKNQVKPEKDINFKWFQCCSFTM